MYVLTRGQTLQAENLIELSLLHTSSELTKVKVWNYYRTGRGLFWQKSPIVEQNGPDGAHACGGNQEVHGHSAGQRVDVVPGVDIMKQFRSEFTDET
jgi:hypothetical protein